MKYVKSSLQLAVYVCLFLAIGSTTVSAQNNSPQLEQGDVTNTQDVTDPTITGEWVYDPKVTEIGKNAERARQLVFWVFSKPPIYSAPVLGQMWSITRNTAYILVAFIIVLLGLHLVMTKSRIGPTFSGISLGYDPGLNTRSILSRVLFMLIFITFSYILVLGMIQFSSITMQFFIERVGGCDLFNIKFSGEGTKCIWPSDEQYNNLVQQMEKNYTEFLGYRLADPAQKNLEMINTSMFLIQVTSATYNILSVVMILRYVVLWFFLILSPFLALLLPMIFIRNTGWIWIGEFFRWLFYGPLVALFIAAISRIWKAGIPFPFDFARVDEPAGQVYTTSISILYGGPSQQLSPTNSANYIDTYAEYVISIIMLWTAIILPWFLLRIFRDYCCDVLKENQATLKQFLNRFRSTPPPSPSPHTPSGDTTENGKTIDLPFRKQDIKIPQPSQKATVTQKTNIESVSTEQIQKQLNLNISSLSDIARAETNTQTHNQLRSTIQQLQHPNQAKDEKQRKELNKIRSTLTQRAAVGDRTAKELIRVASPSAYKTAQVEKPQEHIKELRKTINSIEDTTEKHHTSTVTEDKENYQEAINEIAKQKNISVETVDTVVSNLQENIPITKDTMQSVADTNQLSPHQVHTILSESVKKQIIYPPETISRTAQQSNTTKENVQNTLSYLPLAEGTKQEKVKYIAKQTNIPEETTEKIIDAAKPPQKQKQQKTVAPQGKVSIDNYEDIKQMWVNHYKNSDIPRSDNVTSRERWLESEIPQLSNTLNLLLSEDKDDREKGFDLVLNSIPYLLLGDFSDVEIALYIKAKVEAAKQVMDTLKTQDSQKDKEPDDEFVTIPTVPSKTEQEEQEKQKSMKLPGSNSKTDDASKQNDKSGTNSSQILEDTYE